MSINTQNTLTTLTTQDTQNFLPRILAIVFPQFHEDPLNDHLWGKGFTDWDNLKKAPSKNRLGFRIPRPTELGYYDYSKLEPRKRQGELAKEFGIDGFVYHHYWFYDPDHPGPSLNAPISNMLIDGHPDMPFALHWCAMKWTNTWSGQVGKDFVFKEDGVLQKQYFPKKKDDPLILEHYNWLKPFFHHPNYIKVDGMPLFMLYQKKPGANNVLRALKELAIKDGFPGLYFTVGLTTNHDHLMPIDDTKAWDPPPQKSQRILDQGVFDKFVSYPNPSDWMEDRVFEIPEWCTHQQFDDKERMRSIAGIISSFDNTPRRNYDNARVWSNDIPEKILEKFKNNLHASLFYEACCFPDDMKARILTKKEDDDRFVVINAMNEWAEGMSLEPSDVYGRGFLQAIQDVKNGLITNGCTL